jgi:Ca-activated chloride channel family protein
MKFLTALIFSALVTLLSAAAAEGQSRHSSKGESSTQGTILSVTAFREDVKDTQIQVSDLYLHENGIEQKIKNFSVDPSPARIVLLVDNSQTLPTSIDLMKQAAMEFAYEIFDGDQLFTIAYDEKAEIIQEWTDDAKKMEASYETFRKKGNPYLFDAIDISLKEVLIPLMPGTRKTAVVIIGDGLDRGSKASFEKVLSELQAANVTVYALQIADRTGGAFRRDQPKAGAVLTQLVEGTGGRIFPFAEAQVAAKAICDELRKNRFLLSYQPTNASSYDARRIFLMANEGISVRTKAFHPPNVK